MSMAKQIGGNWVPAVPMRGPVDVRWRCAHEWILHTHPSGEPSHLDFDCVRCGATAESAAWPAPGPYPVRSRLARWLFGSTLTLRR